jgi:hypothetical protein
LALQRAVPARSNLEILHDFKPLDEKQMADLPSTVVNSTTAAMSCSRAR